MLIGSSSAPRSGYGLQAHLPLPAIATYAEGATGNMTDGSCPIWMAKAYVIDGHDDRVSDGWEQRWTSRAKRFYIAEIVRQVSYALASIRGSARAVELAR